MKYILTFIFSLTTIIIYCQTDTSKIIGKYAAGMTRLELKADGTFGLSTPDYVFTPKNRHCTFTPEVKRQHILDSSNTVRFLLKKIEKIGVYTYGFDTKKELIPQDPHSNYFEITILQPVDIERTPRSKKVIIKGKHAFFYEIHGKVLTSGLLLDPLKKTD